MRLHLSTLGIVLIPSCLYWGAILISEDRAHVRVPREVVLPASHPTGRIRATGPVNSSGQVGNPDGETIRSSGIEPTGAATNGNASAPAGSVFINQFQLITQGALLLDQLDRTLSPLAQEALLLDSREKSDVEAVLARMASRIQADRGSPVASIPGEFPESLKMDPAKRREYVADTDVELAKVLDVESLQAVHALGVEYLMLSPFLVGMEKMAPIPSDSGMINVGLTIGGATIWVPFNKVTLSSIADFK